MRFFALLGAVAVGQPTPAWVRAATSALVIVSNDEVSVGWLLGTLMVVGVSEATSDYMAVRYSNWSTLLSSSEYFHSSSAL